MVFAALGTSWTQNRLTASPTALIINTLQRRMMSVNLVLSCVTSVRKRTLANSVQPTTSGLAASALSYALIIAPSVKVSCAQVVRKASLLRKTKVTVKRAQQGHF